MKTKYLFAFFGFAIIIGLQFVNAGVGVQAYTKLDNTTSITRNYGFFQYGDSINRQPNNLCFGSICLGYDIDETDHIPRGNPLQAIIIYGLDPISDWNARFPDSTIDYCRILVREQHLAQFGNNNTFYINYTLNRTFTAEDITTKSMSRHFVFLQRGDYAEVFFDCHFTGAIQTILNPASFEIEVPTKNCLQCTYYNGVVNEFDDIVSDVLQDYTNEITDAIIQFIVFNFEILGYGFWVAMIFLLFAVLGAGLIVLDWVYLFIKSRIRRV